MSTRHVIMTIALTAALLAGCGTDENSLERSTLFTGLWKTGDEGGGGILWEMEQTGDLLTGRLYVESFDGLEDPVEFMNGAVRGDVASFDLDLSGLEADDPFIAAPQIAGRACVIELYEDTLGGGGELRIDQAENAASKVDSSGKLTIDVDTPTCPLPSYPALADIFITPVIFHASGGVPPYEWTAVGLPGGMRLDSRTGVLTGTPAALPGTYEFTVVVTDKSVIESMHVDAVLPAANLLDMTVTACNADSCFSGRISAPRQHSGF